jgi:hypothetical protein
LAADHSRSAAGTAWGSRTVRAGASYFLLVFAAGWILGPIRVLWADPRFGAMTAILLEAAIMLVAMWRAARWSMRRFAVPGSLAATASMGLVALGILLPAELAGAFLRKLPVRQYLEGFANPPGIVALAMFMLFAAMPVLITRSRDHQALRCRGRR